MTTSSTTVSSASASDATAAATMITVLYVIAGIAVLALVVAAAIVVRERSRADAASISANGSHAAPPPLDEPMTGLESALARVTGRDGRPIREAIDAEAAHVDELRVPDDTGPLLRRALDHVEHRDDADPPV